MKTLRFFGEQVVPMTDEEALYIARKLKYKYVPKGQALRKALSKSSRLYYIVKGKVACSFPSA